MPGDIRSKGIVLGHLNGEVSLGNFLQRAVDPGDRLCGVLAGTVLAAIQGHQGSRGQQAQHCQHGGQGAPVLAHAAAELVHGRHQRVDGVIQRLPGSQDKLPGLHGLLLRSGSIRDTVNRSGDGREQAESRADRLHGAGVGQFADTAITVPAGEILDSLQQLGRVGTEAPGQLLAVAPAGIDLRDRAVDALAEPQGLLGNGYSRG